MRKFIIVGETIINIDRIGAAYIVDNLTVDRHISGLTGSYSVQIEIDCGAHTHTTYMTGYQTREAANEFLTKMFDTLNGNKEKEAENSGKPEPVSFEKYEDQWVKAKLTYNGSRMKLEVGKEYMIRPFAARNAYAEHKYVLVRPKENSKITKHLDWDAVQFVLAGQKKGESYE